MALGAAQLAEKVSSDSNMAVLPDEATVTVIVRRNNLSVFSKEDTRLYIYAQ